MKTIQIGLIGDHDPGKTAHVAIPKALALAAAARDCHLDLAWLPTDSDRPIGGAAGRDFDAFWCVPGSPYASFEGALAGIRCAREQRRPFLGTCGGFQHALLEYARNVLDMPDADHAESNPTAAIPLISPLACSLAETSGVIRLDPRSQAGRIYAREEVIESFNCNFGLNPRFREIFSKGDLQFSGFDPNGEPRIFELRGHPFFIGTLFQPERSGLRGETHPLIVAFVTAAAGR